MKTNVSPLKGVLLSASFTFEQVFKAKANRVGLLIFILFAAAMPVLSSVFGFLDYSSLDSQSGKPEAVYFVNETDLTDIDLSDLSDSYLYKGIEFKMEEGSLTENTMRLILTEGSQSDYSLSVERSQDTLIADDMASMICAAVSNRVRKVSLIKKGVPADLVEKISDGSYAMGFSEEEYAEYLEEQKLPLDNDEIGDFNNFNNEETEDDSFENNYNLQFPVSVLMMMVSIFSASYIIREVIKEKASKLAELLMIGMRADVMLFGKVLGALTYVIVMIGSSLLAALISDTITEGFTGKSMFAGFKTALASSASSIGAADLLILFINMILGILFFGILSGVIAAGCEREEDTSSALGIPMILIMAAYMVSIVGGSFVSQTAAKICCLIPCLSGFMLPVKYMTGEVDIIIVIASFLITSGCILMLADLAGKVYASLMVYSGKRLGFLQILGMAKSERKGRK